jgi:hypothetical protein
MRFNGDMQLNPGSKLGPRPTMTSAMPRRSGATLYFCIRAPTSASNLRIAINFTRCSGVTATWRNFENHEALAAAEMKIDIRYVARGSSSEDGREGRRNRRATEKSESNLC